MYLWQLPLLLIGLYGFIYSQWTKKSKAVVLAWLLLSPVPAAITIAVPHVVRTLPIFVPLSIFVSIGISLLMIKMQHQNAFKRNVLSLILIIICFANVFYFLNQYFVQMNKYFAPNWQYGFQEAIESVRSKDSSYSHVVISNEGTLDQSYIFFLFYTKYPPAKFQEEIQPYLQMLPYRKVGKYEFRQIRWEKQDELKRDTLFLGSPTELPENGSYIKRIMYPNGKEAMRIIDHQLNEKI